MPHCKRRLYVSDILSQRTADFLMTVYNKLSKSRQRELPESKHVTDRPNSRPAEQNECVEGWSDVMFELGRYKQRLKKIDCFIAISNRILENKYCPCNLDSETIHLK